MSSSNPLITHELKKKLRSVLLTKAGGIELHRVRSDYEKFLHEPLPFRQLGYKDVASFLQALPDVARYVS